MSKRRFRVNPDGSVTLWMKARGIGCHSVTKHLPATHKLVDGRWVPIEEDPQDATE